MKSVEFGDNLSLLKLVFCQSENLCVSNPFVLLQLFSELQIQVFQEVQQGGYYPVKSTVADCNL